MRTKPDQSEHEIQSLILDWLNAQHIFHWRNNTGAMAGTHKGKRWFMRFGGVKGSPDIYAVINGQIIGIEVKAAKNPQSQQQYEFQIAFEKAGGIYILARRLEDVGLGLAAALQLAKVKHAL